MVLVSTAGFVLSMFYRASVTVISEDLSLEMGLSPMDLGSLSAAFFYVFAAAQPFMGPALDRIGPRIMMTGLGLVSVAGALVFGLAESEGQLVTARILLGIGMSCNYMGALTLFARWFPPHLFGTLLGLITATGALGMLLATSPLAWLSQALGWRIAFLAVACVNLIQVLLFFLVARDHPPNRKDRITFPKENPFAGLLSLAGTRHFWLISIGSFFRFGSYMALQSLWAGPFLMAGLGFTRMEAGNVLLCLSLGYALGLVAFGRLSDRLGSRKEVILPGFFGLSALFLSLAFWPPDLPVWFYAALFLLMGLAASAGQMAYAHIKDLVPPHMTATALTGINLFNMLGPAVLLQAGGLLLSESSARTAQAGDFAPIWIVFSASLALSGLGYTLVPRQRAETGKTGELPDQSSRGGPHGSPLSHHRAYLLGTTAVSFNFQRVVSSRQADEPLLGEPVQSHGLVGDPCARRPPPALARERLHPRAELLHAAAYEETRECIRAFTLFQPQASEFTTNPLVEANKLSFTSGQLEIRQPADAIRVQLPDSFLEWNRSVALQQKTHLGFEPVQARGCYRESAALQEPIAQEFALVHVIDRAFPLVYAQFQALRQEGRDRFHHPFASLQTVHIDVAVVRVTAERVAPLLQFFVQVVQKQVGQERRQGTALRRSLVAANTDAVLHHARIEECSRDAQEPLVLHVSGQPRHQYVVTHPVEKLLQVHVHDKDASILHVLLRLFQCVMCSAARPEAEAAFRECRVQNRCEDLQHRLLHQSVARGGDAQLAHPSAGLGDPHPLNRLWRVGSVKQAADQLVLVGVQPFAQLADVHPVDAWRALVGFHPQVGLIQVRAIANLFHKIRRQGSSSLRRRERSCSSIGPAQVPPLPGASRRGRATFPASCARRAAGDCSLVKRFGPSPAQGAGYYGLC